MALMLLFHAIPANTSRISRPRFVALIPAHFLSMLTYACQVWSGFPSSNLKRRLQSSYFKMKRLLWRDFKGKISREKLISISGLKSLRFIFVVRDAKLLHKICITLKPEPLVERLVSQCYIQSRCENKLFFMTTVTRRLVATVLLTEQNALLTFEWLNFSDASFYKNLNLILPSFLKL
jgi:hypothetical protein